jgi:hypothetical protein
MYNVTNIQNGLFGLVGFNQPFDPSYQILEPDLLESRSGRRIDDNPFTSIRSIHSTQNYDNINDSEFNEFLRRTIKSSINEVMDSVFMRSDFIDRQVLYKYPMNKAKNVDLPNGFVGYKIDVSNTKNVAFEITRCFFDFDIVTVPETIKLLLFSTDKLDPIYSKEVLVDSDRIEVDLKWVVDNTGSVYKGEYYLGYLTDGLTLKPYDRNYNSGNIESVISELCIQRGKVPNHNTETLFDLEDWDGISTSTGLNPDITVYEDYTDLIINNEKLFSKAIYLSSCLKFMSMYAASLRSNRDQRDTERQLLLVLQQIEGQSGEGLQKVIGYRTKLSSAIKEIAAEIKKLKDSYFSDDMITVTTMS